MVTKKEIKLSFLIALWFMVLTFPIMVVKVNTIKNIVIFRWHNLLWVGVLGFFASLIWNYFLRMKEERKKADIKDNIPLVHRLLQNERFKIPFLAAIAIFAVVYPFVFPMYHTSIMISALVYVMLGLGLNIVVGLAGLLDLGYVAFYAVGAYSYALLNLHFGISFWIVLPISALLGTIFGTLLGYPVLRLRGDYLAIVTLGFGEIIRIILENWDELGNGPRGIGNIPPPSFFGHQFNQHDSVIYIYFIVIALVLLTIFFVNRLVGGGHAHMMTLENIGSFVEKGFKVTVIGPSFYHYYSGMGPGMLGGTYRPEDIRFATKKVVQKQGGIFVKDRVVRIDPDKKEIYTLAGHRFAYDVISFNAGSFVPMQAAGKEQPSIYPVKPIEKLMEAADKLKVLFSQKKGVVSVVGGGPSSAEVAGNVWQLAENSGSYAPDIHIFAGNKFMSRFPESVRLRVISSLEKRGINIHEIGYVREIKSDEIRLESGQVFSTDFTFMALGVKPSSIFAESGMPVGPDNGLLVNQFLQSVAYPEIFGGGDCICFKDKPLDKVGVYAVRQNPVLLNNLMAALEGTALGIFDPGPDYLLIFNIGGGLGVLKKKRVVFGGRPAFWVKDYIDRKFMKTFQAIEKKM